MSWTDDELERIGRAEELRLRSVRSDGTLRPSVTIWVVRVGGGLFIRSGGGPQNAWYRRARKSGAARIDAGGITADVALEPFYDPDDAVGGAYRSKYERRGPYLVGLLTSADARATTLRLVT